MGKQVLERCTFCFNHNKKICLGRPNGGTRFTNRCFVEDVKKQGKLIAKGERNG
jgi:hypothetical protein